MKSNTFIKSLGVISLILVFLMISTGIVSGKTVTFKAVSFLPKGNPTAKAFGMMVDDFNKAFKGEASIFWAGGPEVIPAMQQAEAVRKGAIDMAATSSAFYTSILPVSLVTMYSNLTHEEMRKEGFFDTFAQLHQKAGLIYFGELAYGRRFYIYSNFKVQSPADLTGKKIRVFPAIMPFVKSLDAAPIMMQMAEIYTAMERGVVDGFAMATIGFVKGFSWHEVTKYMIDHGYYRGSVACIVNPKKWNQLSKDLQDRIVKWKYEVFDPKTEPFLIKQGKFNKKLIYDSKVEVIKFSPSDAEAYLKLAYDSAWRAVTKKAPDIAPKLKGMLVK
jgi:TRAP-type C4-dicarboxylate transport system substrate-binding protein